MEQTVAEFMAEVAAMLAEEGWQEPYCGPGIQGPSERGMVPVYSLFGTVGGERVMRVFETATLAAQPDPVAWLRDAVRKERA
jgi:hypothetical protein